MNILHITHTDPFSDNRILKEINSLSKIENYEITCFGIKIGEENANSNINIRSNLISISLVFRIKYLFKFLRHLLMFAELFCRFLIMSIKIKPKIVHCHDTLVLPIGLVVSLIFKSKLIYDAHELESDKNGQNFLMSCGTLIIEKMCWWRIDHLISVSDSIISWYEKNIGKKNNTLILNSPYLNYSKRYKKKYFHKLFNIPENAKVFVYLGILNSGRGIQKIINVFKSKNIYSHVVFIGYGSLKEEILQSSIKFNNIHIHDPVPHEEVVSLVSSADFGFSLIENVSLSDYLCLPNKLFEYAFAGTPVLASNFPEIKKIVDKYKLGYVCKLNEKSIIKEVIKIQNENKTFELTNLDDISWAEQERKIINCYSKLI